MGMATKFKTYRKEARKMYRETVELIAQRDQRFLKPKPRWFPAWLWIRLLSIFVCVKK